MKIRVLGVRTLADDSAVLRLSIDGKMQDVPLDVGEVERLAVEASRTLGYIAVRALFPAEYERVEQIGSPKAGSVDG